MRKGAALFLLALGMAALGGILAYAWKASTRVSQQIAQKVHKLDSDLQNVLRQDAFLEVVQADGFRCEVPQAVRAEIHCDWRPDDPMRRLHLDNGIVIDAEFIDGRKVTAYKLQRTSSGP